MKQLYTFVFLLIAVNVAAQKNYETEQIIWNGKTYPYRYHHMEQYFRYYPSKRPVPNKDTTIINRKYLAVFEVKENKFYLNNMYIHGKNQKVKDLSVLQELNTTNEPMFLSWVNGLFDIGMGTERFSANDSLIPIYDQYIVFEVKKGIIGRTETFTHNQLKLFKDYQYRRFKETLDYQKLMRRLLYNGMSEGEASLHIYQFILFYSKSNFLRRT
ncbi:hypothetical protein MG290_12510 [Flavobacterium sp. CBA20B-1]|uniref:hypothetical protein n=1 Tax=unclassified Flavobacterium TaxID=196869 RepID=UPI0022251230|nr:MULTISPECIES: hypothetical protein [unclassified Flavobacterium]WCM41757.1 hypothetical protein MG290_12510 [Flavobacterium sp. CBA20B-1]